MNETLEKQVFEIEKIEVENLPELQGLKEKQLQVVKDNPFVKITDSKTYEEAKKARTALVTARTSIGEQDKFLASLIKKFREKVANKTAELIAITKPHEEKQQEEVKRWEAVKEAEKQEKARIEEERKQNIRNSINSIIDTAFEKINKLSFDTIDSLKVDFEQNLYKTDVETFEEFELDFNEKLIQVKNALSSKVQALEEAEQQRLEKIRLEEEKKRIAEAQAKLEADRKAEEERLLAERKAEEERLAKIKADQEAELQAERQKLADEKAKQDAEIKAQQDKINAENKKIQDEKDRLAKEEADRIAAEKAEQQAKEEAERKAKETAETEERAKAEAARLEALKPEKEKVISYLEDLENAISDIDAPVINDSALLNSQKLVISELNNIISNFKEVITNFK